MWASPSVLVGQATMSLATCPAPAPSGATGHHRYRDRGATRSPETCCTPLTSHVSPLLPLWGTGHVGGSRVAMSLVAILGAVSETGQQQRGKGKD